MMIDVKLSRKLLEVIITDLLRPHRFAAERVGFVTAKLTETTEGRRLLLFSSYESIPDDEYINDRKVGARIDQRAITRGSHLAFRGRAFAEGVFHVHLHDMSGCPSMSLTDSREIPPMIETFRAIGRTACHGILILSRNSLATWVWQPGENEPVRPRLASVIGNPLMIIRRKVGQ